MNLNRCRFQRSTSLFSKAKQSSFRPSLDSSFVRYFSSDGFSALARAELGGFGSIRASIIGVPHVGKSTQCKKISNELGIPHVSLQALVDSAMRSYKPLGKQVKALVSAGTRLPEETVVEMVVLRLKEHDCQVHGYVLDGLPRTSMEAQALIDAGVLPQYVVQLYLPAEFIQQRVQASLASAEAATEKANKSEQGENENELGIFSFNSNQSNAEHVQLPPESHSTSEQCQEVMSMYETCGLDSAPEAIDATGERAEVFTRLKQALGGQ